MDVAQREFFSFPASVSWDVERAEDLFARLDGGSDVPLYLRPPSPPRVEALSATPVAPPRFPPLSHSPSLSLSLYPRQLWLITYRGGAPSSPPSPPPLAAPGVTLSGGESHLSSISERGKREGGEGRGGGFLISSLALFDRV